MNDGMVAAEQEFARAVDEAASELRRVCAAVEYAGLDLDFADVVFGLLARQYQLWTVLVLSPSAWTTAASPLLLRGLVDAAITLGWIARNPDSARRFKVYSAGRMKLLAEHWRARGSAEAESWQSAYAEELSELVDSEVWRGILPVELANWSGKDIRTMAEEAELKDMYDLAYSPLSADAHAEWMALRRKYLKPCEEEVHRSHWLPVFERPWLDTGVPTAATGPFRLSIQIALGALNLEYDVQFWDGIEEEIATASRLVEEVQTSATGEG